MLQGMEVVKGNRCTEGSLECGTLLVSCDAGLLNPVFVAMPLGLMVDVLAVDA
jgi:uncharacterized membrane protein